MKWFPACDGSWPRTAPAPQPGLPRVVLPDEICWTVDDPISRTEVHLPGFDLPAAEPFGAGLDWDMGDGNVGPMVFGGDRPVVKLSFSGPQVVPPELRLFVVRVVLKRAGRRSVGG